jgi:hypothetical protein
MTSRPEARKRLVELVTGALVTLAIEFGVAVVLFVAAIAAAALILTLAT